MLAKMAGKMIGKVLVSGLITSAIFILNNQGKGTSKEIYELGKQGLNQMKNK